jgi:hypothetical protein
MIWRALDVEVVRVDTMGERRGQQSWEVALVGDGSPPPMGEKR